MTLFERQPGNDHYRMLSIAPSWVGDRLERISSNEHSTATDTVNRIIGLHAAYHTIREEGGLPYRQLDGKIDVFDPIPAKEPRSSDPLTTIHVNITSDNYEHLHPMTSDDEYDLWDFWPSAVDYYQYCRSLQAAGASFYVLQKDMSVHGLKISGPPGDFEHPDPA